MKDKVAVWEDLTTQLKDWITGGFVPNKGDKMFATGYGGSGKENETMSPSDFFGVRDDWLKLYGSVDKLCLSLSFQFALPQGRGLAFVVNQSQSGYASLNTCDLVCKLDETVMKGKWPSTTTLKTFAYHIDVPGIKDCGGPAGKVPTIAPKEGEVPKI